MSGGEDVRTTVCPDGPLLVRGASSWPDADGEEHPVRRPVVAVCRCDRSQLAPWCDGTHKALPRGWDTESGGPGMRVRKVTSSEGG